MAVQINKRMENVATDQKLRTGKEVHPRRSDFIEWYDLCISGDTVGHFESKRGAKNTSQFWLFNYHFSNYES